MLLAVARRSTALFGTGIRKFSGDLPEVGGYFTKYLDLAQSNQTPEAIEEGEFDHSPDEEDFDDGGLLNLKIERRSGPTYDAEEDLVFDEDESSDEDNDDGFSGEQEVKLVQCRGKRQRRGFKAATCELIDLDDLHFTNVSLLERFVSNSGTINPRRETKLCAKCQRQVASTIKQARQFVMIPYVQEWRTVDKTKMLDDVSKGGRHDRKLGVYAPKM